jgi:glycosyltransferase involved in cell wall biosynthesis
VSESLPSVALVLPVLDEAASIDQCLRSISEQDYRGPLEVVVADGGSTDGTRRRLEEWAEELPLRVIDNPRRRQSPGINLAVSATKAEILVRVDGHTIYPPDYVSASVAALMASSAGAVGGALHPQGETRFGRAVAAAMLSPAATGPARFHRPNAAGVVDTVYLGAVRREEFVALGGLRSFPSGAGEDADFYFRMRRSGRTVLLDPGITSRYRPRDTAGALLRQHFRYGQAKAELLWANGRFPSWRPLAPAALVFGLAATMLLAATGTWWPLAVLGGAWLLLLLAASLPAGTLAPLVVAAAGLMQIGYGCGFWWSLIRGPGRVRRSIAGSQPPS